jgi:predicted small secreted protein
MIKKGSLVFLAVILSLSATGCGTACGVGKGVAGGTYVAASQTGKGVSDDARGLVKAIKIADNWIRENLW